MKTVSLLARVCAVLFYSLIGFVGPAAAQWQVPAGAVPIGRGAGQTGFDSVPITTFTANVRTSGAKCDVSTTGSGNAITTAGGTGLQTSTGAFSAADIGKRIRIVPAAVVAITIASPGVITWTSHGLAANAPVQLTTTGALPTGLVSQNSIGGQQIYYVVGASITANTFQVSLAPGGAAINTSGTQSGTQTAFSYTTMDTTIASVSSATSIGLAATVPSTGTVGQFWYGTDDSAAIQSAVNAAVAAGSSQSDVYVPGNTPCLIASTITVAGAMKMHGDGKTVSNLFLGTRSMDGITVTAGGTTVGGNPGGVTGTSNAFTMRDMGIFSIGVPTSGGAVRLDTGTNNSANFHSIINNVRFNGVYIGVYAARASYYTVSDSIFESNILNDVLQQSLHNVDYDSGHIGPNNQFLSWFTPQSSQSHVEIQGGGSTTVEGNRFLGGNNNVFLNWQGGTSGELFISGNHMEVTGQATASGASAISQAACVRIAVPGGSGFGRVKITNNELSCLAPAGGSVWDIVTQGTGTISEFLVDDNLINFGGAGTAIGLQFDFVSHAKIGAGNIFTNLGGPTATGIIAGSSSAGVEFGHPAFFGTFSSQITNNIPAGQFSFAPFPTGTAHGDSNYQILSTDRYVYTNATFTAARTWTLPPAASVTAGQSIIIQDAANGITATNTLLVARFGADTINTSGLSVLINSAKGGTILISDGVSNWGTAGGTGGVTPIAQGGTGQTTAAAARGSSGLNIERITGPGDANYSILATDRYVATSSLTAPRTWTLPAANSVNPGQAVVIYDAGNQITSTNTLTIARAGSDTIDGAGGSIVLNNSSSYAVLISDGVSNWGAGLMGVSLGGTGIASGTSGGIPYFAATTRMASSAALTAGLPVVGGGPGAAPTTMDPAPITNSLGADVALNNTANYFTGPTVAQGSTGTWCVSGTVTALDTAGAATFFARLWDGTTVIASAGAVSAATNFSIPFSLSGCITSPAGNLRIDVKDISSTSGLIKFNQTLNSKDSTITAWRVK